MARTAPTLLSWTSAVRSRRLDPDLECQVLMSLAAALRAGYYEDITDEIIDLYIDECIAEELEAVMGRPYDATQHTVYPPHSSP